ncbi:hypothetical protein ACR4U3_004867 [Salmonella enterica]
MKKIMVATTAMFVMVGSASAATFSTTHPENQAVDTGTASFIFNTQAAVPKVNVVLDTNKTVTPAGEGKAGVIASSAKFSDIPTNASLCLSTTSNPGKGVVTVFSGTTSGDTLLNNSTENNKCGTGDNSYTLAYHVNTAAIAGQHFAPSVNYSLYLP